MSDEELRLVLFSEELDVRGEHRERTVQDAKNLIRWCLKGDPTARPRQPPPPTQCHVG